MKAIHFCTPKKLAEIKKKEYFHSWRTGWIPNMYAKDIVKINERVGKKDTFLFNAEVLSVQFLPFEFLDPEDEEVLRYNKKFHPRHFFYKICFRKIKPRLEDFL